MYYGDRQWWKPSDSDTKDNDIVQRNKIEHEWKIISRLHHAQNIECSKIDMLGRRGIDKHKNWSIDYKGEEYTIAAINFIGNMKSHGCLIYDDIPQCINCMTLGEK